LELAERCIVNHAFRYKAHTLIIDNATGAGLMSSRTQPSYDAKPTCTDAPAPDLCSQYRGIGIAAVAAAATAGKPKPTNPVSG